MRGGWREVETHRWGGRAEERWEAGESSGNGGTAYKAEEAQVWTERQAEREHTNTGGGETKGKQQRRHIKPRKPNYKKEQHHDTVV